MDPGIIGILGIVIMLILFMTKMPVAYVMTIIGFVGFSLMKTWAGGLNLLSRSMYEAFSSYGLTTIPLFILMGQFAFNAGIGKKLYDTAYKFFGNVRGGLAMATIAACTAFGSVCGSSPATAATLAVVGLPEMRRYGYDDELSTGSVASGGGLGMIMPPSVVMIVYGVLTEQSIGALFVSGIIPALVMMVLYMITIYIKCIQHPHLGPPGEKFTWAEKFNSLKDMADTALCFIVVMGGLFFGIFTPTEAAGIGAFSVLAVSVIRKQLNWKGFVKSLYEALRTSCMVIFLIAGALVFGKFLAITRIPFNAASWITDMNMPNFMVLTAIVIIYIIGGSIMDILALIMLTIPVFYPVIINMGYDPIWYGVVIVLLAQIGVLTPPVGINVYVVYGVAQGTIGKVPLEKIFKGVIPFLIATILGIILMTVFPQIILVLPRLMY